MQTYEKMKAGSAGRGAKLFVLVLARDRKMVDAKLNDLKSYGIPYAVVCGERLDAPGVEYREALGKWDAINFGYRLIPDETDVVIINDVDTSIHQLGSALAMASRFDLIYCAVRLRDGPQKSFY